MKISYTPGTKVGGYRARQDLVFSKAFWLLGISLV